ncbi:MAG: hypothetical protein LBI35_09400 [Burkholderiales bacterium]|nr:hypothetical protein [Burkholderiales bacterium]
MGRDRKLEREIKIVSPNEAHIETRVLVPDLKEFFEKQPFALEEKDTLITRMKFKLEKDAIFQEYSYVDADEEKQISLKEPVVVGNKWEIPQFFINTQTGEKTKLQSGVCTIQALGKEIILGKERAVVEVGCSAENEDFIYKEAENLGTVSFSISGEDAKLVLCEDSCDSCGTEEQKSND